ncbi:MAG: hypothetical protein SFU98_10865 [Leptospiraceae bacterium]|nr:hypothetical protein [Leptospiraceae bacterium]
MKTLLIILAIFVSIDLWAKDKIYHDCRHIQTKPVEISGIGDSRAAQLEGTKITKGSDYYYYDEKLKMNIQKLGIYVNNGNAIIHAMNPTNNQPIIDPANNINIVSRAVPGTDTKEWLEKMRQCSYQGIPYMVPNVTYMHIGNDLAAIIQEKKKIKAEYEAFRLARIMKDTLDAINLIITKRMNSLNSVTKKKFISQPLKTIAQIFSDLAAILNATTTVVYTRFYDDAKNKLLSKTTSYEGVLNFHNYWQWRMNQKMDEAVFNMQYITRNVLDQSPNHKLVLNSILPIHPISNIIYVGEITPENVVEIMWLVNAYNGKLRNNLLIGLYSQYGLKRIIYADASPTFLEEITRDINKITRENSDTLFLEGVHFSERGLVKWGRNIANLMVHNGWFTPGAGFVRLPDPKYYSHDEVNKYHIQTMFEALLDGISGEILVNRPLQYQEHALKKDFPEVGKSYFVQHGSEYTHKTQGDIRAKYQSMNEANGEAGSPLSNELCYGPGPSCLNKVQYFENGVIHFDPIHGTNYSKTVLLPSPTKQAELPDFDTCVNSPCGSRWFDFNEYQLVANSGQPPYFWNIVSGDLPEGTVLFENGMIHKPPTNNANGSWKAKVRLTDAKGKTVEKEIRITSGL